MKVSVLMSVYKEPIDWLRQSINSILYQTFKDFEFIIICDNPEYDEGIRLLKEYSQKDNRIVLIFNKENLGLTKSLNKGLAIAKGEYFARMDADDISMANRLERQYAYMEEHPEVIVLGTNIEHIGKKPIISGNDSIKFDDASIRAQMILVNCIAHSSVMLRKSVLDCNDIHYDENYRQSQDYRLWELLMPYGRFACLREKLLKYRMSDQQITRSQKRGQTNLAGGIRLRLQQKWLMSNDYQFSDEDVERHPLGIIEKIRHDKKVNSSLEYKAYLQYAYLYSERDEKKWTNFIIYDLKKMPFISIMRILVKFI